MDGGGKTIWKDDEELRGYIGTRLMDIPGIDSVYAEKISKKLLKSEFMKRIFATNKKGGEIFNFTDKIQSIVRIFRDEGLTIKQYLAAALRQPALFTQSYGTIEGNIRNLVAVFKDEGLTVKQYLAAALRQPALFYQSPDTIKGNIQNLVAAFKDEGLSTKQCLAAAIKCPSIFNMLPSTIEGNIRNLAAAFKDEGLTAEQYLAVALKQPSLFSIPSSTIEGNIRNLVAAFKDEGLTVEQYLNAAIRQPALFYQLLDTIEGNIRNLVAAFKNEGLTVRQYLAAALKLPSLFCLTPETVASKLNIIIKTRDKGLVDFKGKSLMDAIVFYPHVPALSAENLMSRRIALQINYNATGRASSFSNGYSSRTNTTKINEQITDALGEDSAAVHIYREVFGYMKQVKNTLPSISTQRQAA